MMDRITIREKGRIEMEWIYFGKKEVWKNYGENII